MKIYKLNGKIQDGKIEYLGNVTKEYYKFKKENEGKHVDVTIEIMDRPEHFQHKYYRGGLLPAIADAAGEHDIYVQHIVLKFEFLYENADDINSIPKKYMNKGIYEINVERIIGSEMLNNIPCKHIRGVILVFNMSRRFIGYIPSTADLTYDEMKAYIKQCENRLFIDLNGELPEYWGRYKIDNLG